MKRAAGKGSRPEWPRRLRSTCSCAFQVESSMIVNVTYESDAIQRFPSIPVPRRMQWPIGE